VSQAGAALASVWRMSQLELSNPRPDIAALTLNRPEKLNALSYGLVQDLHAALDGNAANAETLCGYGKFGLESTKQVMWANIDAPSLESALHLENRSQILAGTGGYLADVSGAFRHRPQ
jgi:enoyl-CoA hydratase